ncbi:DUF1295 domain-containing protein [Arthrobacter sp. ISL-72]|uniref:DUF1295 domain-containing protein n=1 Tax=Arthrobacter sp. ISL-72 TaxID=2819114 RepID=UPI001BEA2C3D|nr:DUF1295 domain-containing protein [Arthrobacter sp. ISL-72]MBT2595393.1 DUF1295 domain-containing protein [Arthrobacter sp. ISL-72]
MAGFPLNGFLASLPWTALAVAAVLAVTFAVAVAQRRHSVMDVAWGPGFVAVAAVSWLRTVLNTGLWRYTRHPNYFGDAAAWPGLFLVAADSWPGILTVLSPALMVWALAGKTGKPLTEKAMSARPRYKEYVESTSGFIPWPPRQPAGGS